MRRNRAVRLGRRLGLHVFRTGLHPAALDVASVAIPKLSTINDLRRSCARTMGSLTGRSVSARLSIAGCDPSFDAIKRAIMSLVNAIWDNCSLHGTMTRAWMHAQATVSPQNDSRSPLGALQGPLLPPCCVLVGGLPRSTMF